ncbi:MAG: RnfH family protein [Gammaproteobacteria bacterium]
MADGDDDPGRSFTVEVAYARADVQRLIAIEVPAGTRVRAALLASGIVDEFPEIDVAGCPLGIFGRRVDDDHRLAPGDRIEIYRPLSADPREARRQRAALK